MVKKPLGFLLGAGARSVPIPICDDSITSLGRDEENTIALDDLAASRRHAYVEGRGGAIFITDLDSSNGTYIDDVKMDSHQRTRLNSGQEVRIGGKVFFVVSADSPLETQKVTLSRAEAVSKKVTLAGFSLKAMKEAHHKEAQQRQETQQRVQITPPKTTAPADFPSFKRQTIPNRPPSKQEATRKAPISPLASPTANPQAPAAAVSAPAQTGEHALSGGINAGGLPQIIQMINTKRFSGIMKVNGKSPTVTIMFLEGELYSAFSGRKRGTDAVLSCALERDTAFTFDRLEPTAVESTTRNINRPTMQILMECCCKIHEASQG